MRGGLWLVPVVFLVGCGERGSDVPMPTDGANQVVIKVPTMS
jgi:hypothetical protein